MPAFTNRSIDRIIKVVRTVEAWVAAAITPNDEGMDLRQATLLEDASGGSIYASIQTLDGVDELVPFIKFRYKWGLLDGAVPGYQCDCVFFKHEYWFVQGACIPAPCESAGSITPGTAPDGTVGSPFTHTVATSGLTAGTLAASGLPAGLTLNTSTGEISGTPTTAGSFLAVISGTADKTGPGTPSLGEQCTITKALPITIVEAA